MRDRIIENGKRVEVQTQDGAILGTVLAYKIYEGQYVVGLDTPDKCTPYFNGTMRADFDDVKLAEGAANGQG